MDEPLPAKVPSAKVNYYNEYEPKAAAWLRQLIKDGLVPNGTVDTRSIKDVQPSDLKGFTQCHFFAGIGGWSRALQLAGWSSDVPVWTGSCPCQPFSVTGLKKGTADERHLWPEFFRLIRACSPSVVFGEQVAKKAGRQWLSGVFGDLQEAGYRTAGADLSGASIGAPHIRQRLYWVGERWSVGDQRRLAYAISEQEHEEQQRPEDAQGGGNPGLAGGCGVDSGVAESASKRPEVWEPLHGEHDGKGFNQCGTAHWSDVDWLPCRDGKTRRVESGLEPLAHGVPARVVRLSGYGNAIIPPLAATFIEAWKEI